MHLPEHIRDSFHFVIHKGNFVPKRCQDSRAVSWVGEIFVGKIFSGQSKVGNPNASGTGLVRVIAQGLSRSFFIFGSLVLTINFRPRKSLLPD